MISLEVLIQIIGVNDQAFDINNLLQIYYSSNKKNRLIIIRRQQKKMDRSQVREFSMGRSIYNSKVAKMSSVIPSPRSNAQLQLHLRKSRITSIPDTRHINMHDKLDIVVVFQTIEIQRLSQQNQTLRVKARQFERQMFNCENYEVQIKELTQRCYRLQSERNSYREELYECKQASELIFNELDEMKRKYLLVDFTSGEKYKLEKGRSEELVVEVQKWKSRYNALDQSKNRQLQLIRRMMQEKSRTYHSREAKQIFDKFQGEKEEMEQLIKDLRQENVKKQTQLKVYKFEMDQKDDMLEQMERQVDEYEEKVAMLSQENYRLSEMGKARVSEVEKMKDKIRRDDETITKLTQQLASKNQEIKRLTLKLQKVSQSTTEKDNQLNNLQKAYLQDKERLSQLDRIVFLLRERENQLEGKVKIIERKDKRIFSLEETVKNLQGTQASTRKDIDELKQQILQASETISSLLAKINQLSQSHKFMKKSTYESIYNMQAQYANVRQEINQRTEKIIAFSHKFIGQITKNQQYISKLEEINQESSEKITVLQNQKIQVLEEFQNLQQLQDQHQQLAQQYYEAIQQNQKLQSHILHLEKQRKQLIEETEIKQSQITSQTQIMSQTSIQLRTLQQNYEQNIVKSLKNQIESKEKELKEMKNNYELLEKTCKELEKKIKKVGDSSKKEFQEKEAEWQVRLQTLSIQSNEKTQNIKNQKIKSQKLLHTLENFTKFYQSNIQLQIQLILARIQPIESMITQIKKFVLQNLTKKQSQILRIQQIYELKINELMELNLTLMDKNDRLFQTLISNGIVDIKPLQQANLYVTAKRISQEDNTQFLSNLTEGQQNKVLNLNCLKSMKQNFNCSNFTTLGPKTKQTIKTTSNTQTLSSIPIEFLIKHVMVCAQLEALRQKVGDKNAKVQKIKNSLMLSNVSTNKSFIAVVNGNGKSLNQNIIHPQNNMMLESNFISSTIINKVSNHFSASIVQSMNNQPSIIHQSRVIEHNQRAVELNIRRVVSEDRLVRNSPDTSQILDGSQSKNHGIYTKRLGGGSGLGRNGFKSIGFKKLAIYN